MHDDLYAHNIFNFFSRNSLLHLDAGSKQKESTNIDRSSGKKHDVEDRDSFRDAVKNIGKMFSNHNKEVYHRISLRMID